MSPPCMYLILLLAICNTNAIPSLPTRPSTNAIILQKDINAMSPGQHLTLPPATYTFSNTSLTITNAVNITIDATDATLIFYYGYGVSITSSSNCLFLSFTLDSYPPNYAQGIVTSTSSSSFTATFSHDFIPPDTIAKTSPFSTKSGLAGAKVAFWDNQTKYMLPLGNQFMKNSHSIDDYQYTIQLVNPLRGNIIPNNTPVTIIPRRGITWDIYNSSNITTKDVTIHAGGNMGFHERAGYGGNVYRNVSIIRKPGSTGLLALNADGFHSDSVGKGPLLEDSEISYTGDDFVNIHNRMLVICGSSATNALSIIDVSTQVKGGGTLEELNRAAAAAAASSASPPKLSIYQLGQNCKSGCKTSNPLLWRGAVQKSVLETNQTILTSCRNAYSAMQAPPYNASLIIHGLSQVVYSVTFVQTVPNAIRHELYNLAQYMGRSGANAIVRRNHFHDGYSRMGLLKSFNLSYYDNVVERANGLYVFEEQEWLEGL